MARRMSTDVVHVLVCLPYLVHPRTMTPLPAATAPSSVSAQPLHPLLRRENDQGHTQYQYSSPQWLRVAPGVHAPRHAWECSGPRERHLFLIEAARGKYGDEVVLAGVSAALVLGLPLVGPLPHQVEVVANGRTRRRTALLRRRATPAHAVQRAGCLTTPVPATLIDLARWHGVVMGVCAMDHALRTHLCTYDDLSTALEQLVRGSAGAPGARTAVHLADGRSESPGESLSRVRMWEARLPRPDLQVEKVVAGRRVRVDFSWSDPGLVGEFDGREKYHQASYGRDPEDVLWDEKLREDEIRASGLRIVRWVWEHAWSAGGTQMLRRLALYGVHPTGRRW